MTRAIMVIMALGNYQDILAGVATVNHDGG